MFLYCLGSTEQHYNGTELPVYFCIFTKYIYETKTINYTVTVIKLQYIFGGGVKGRAGKKGKHCARKNMCFVLQKQKVRPKPSFWKFYTTQIQTHTHTHTPSRTPLNTLSTPLTGRYLHNTLQTNRRISMPSAGFKLAIAEIQYLQPTPYSV